MSGAASYASPVQGPFGQANPFNPALTRHLVRHLEQHILVGLAIPADQHRLIVIAGPRNILARLMARLMGRQVPALARAMSSAKIKIRSAAHPFADGLHIATDVFKSAA